jgi:putative membrane protein
VNADAVPRFDVWHCIPPSFSCALIAGGLNSATYRPRFSVRLPRKPERAAPLLVAANTEERMIKLVAYGAFLLAATPVMAQSVSEKTGVNSVVGVAPSTQDFVTEAAQSDMFEIQSSKLALNSADAPTKAFAQQMITDHTKTSDELKAAVGKGEAHATLPTAMSSSQQSMLDKLNGLHSADFDKQYHSDQVSGHKDAVSLFQRYAKGGEDAGLKAWANTTAPTLEHHLQMAQDLNK